MNLLAWLNENLYLNMKYALGCAREQIARALALVANDCSAVAFFWSSLRRTLNYIFIHSSSLSFLLFFILVPRARVICSGVVLNIFDILCVRAHTAQRQFSLIVLHLVFECVSLSVCLCPHKPYVAVSVGA